LQNPNIRAKLRRGFEPPLIDMPEIPWRIVMELTLFVPLLNGKAQKENQPCDG
jgi:hypothetical protein